jgi:hypothetical protein
VGKESLFEVVTFKSPIPFSINLPLPVHLHALNFQSASQVIVSMIQ